MSKVLVIGAGGVSSVAVHKMAMNSGIFSHISLASRTKAKCDAIAASVKSRTGVTVDTYEIDAEEIQAMIRLIESIQPKLVVNLALPYQDLAIMDACLATGVDYMDTANYEPRHEAKFEYHWQWAYHDRFKEKGIMALLGSGFDPGVTSVFATWLKKHKLKTIRTLDILDCNGGDHGQAFATNFNPEINIREVTAPARHWLHGEWVETPTTPPARSASDKSLSRCQAPRILNEPIGCRLSALSQMRVPLISASSSGVCGSSSAILAAARLTPSALGACICCADMKQSYMRVRGP